MGINTTEDGGNHQRPHQVYHWGQVHVPIISPVIQETQSVFVWHHQELDGPVQYCRLHFITDKMIQGGNKS